MYIPCKNNDLKSFSVTSCSQVFKKWSKKRRSFALAKQQEMVANNLVSQFEIQSSSIGRHSESVEKLFLLHSLNK